MITIEKGSTDQTLHVRAVDAISGQPKTGLVYGDITARYVRTRSAPVAITMATLGSVDAAHSDGGFIEIDATNCKGFYRFDIPDAAFATGADQVVITLQADDALLTPVDVQLSDAAPGGLEADVTRIRKFIANSRQVDHATTPNVETILDDDDVTPYATITQSEPTTGVVKETVTLS